MDIYGQALQTVFIENTHVSEMIVLIEAVDCLLDETWQKWGKCSVRCGMGVRNRTRRIINYPRNGGKECESTLQYGICEGVKCKVPRTLSTTTRKLKGKRMPSFAYIFLVSVIAPTYELL